MGKLKHFMASKYPQKKIVEEEILEPINEEITTISTNEDESFFNMRRKRLLKISLFLGVLFFILSFPMTYKLMGKILNNVPGFKHTVSEDISHHLDWKIVTIHSIIFSMISYIILEFSLKD